MEYNELNGLPKSDDVLYEDSDGNRVIKINNDNQQSIIDFAQGRFAAQFVGCACPGCGEVIRDAEHAFEFDIYGGDCLWHEDCWNRSKS